MLTGLLIVAWLVVHRDEPPLTPLGHYVVATYYPEALAEYVFRPVSHLFLLALVIVGAWVTTGRLAPGEGDRAFGPFTARPWTLAVITALAVTATSAAVGQFAMGGTPRIQDERAYVFQAHLFRAGKIWIPIPPEPVGKAAWVDFTVQKDGRWYSRFPPGWSVFLAAAMPLGLLPWLNPVLTGLGLIGLWLWVRRSEGERAGVVALMLAAASPFLTMMGGSLLSHPLALILGLGCLEGWRRGVLALEAGQPLAMGATTLWASCAAVLWLTRPTEGLFHAAVPALHVGWLWWNGPGTNQPRGPAPRARSLKPIAVAAVLLGSAVGLGLAYNVATTGDPWVPATLRFSPDDHPGFNPRVGGYLPEGHNPRRAVQVTLLQWKITSDLLFGWPYVSLVPALIGLLALPARDRFERGWLGMILCYLAFMFTWHSPGLGHGSRYHHVLVPILLVFTVRGLKALLTASPPHRRDRARCAMALTLVYLTVVSLTTCWPQRLALVRAFYRIAPVRPSLGGLDLSRTVLVVPELWVDGLQEVFSCFEGLTTPWPDGPGPIIVRDQPGVRQAVARFAPGRRVVTLDPQGIRQVLEQWMGTQVRLLTAELPPERTHETTPSPAP